MACRVKWCEIKDHILQCTIITHWYNIIDLDKVSQILSCCTWKDSQASNIRGWMTAMSSMGATRWVEWPDYLHIIAREVGEVSLTSSMMHVMSECFVTAPTDSRMTPADWEMLMTAATDLASGKHLFNSAGIDGTNKIQEVQVRPQILC